MTDNHTFYLQTHWGQCDIPSNSRDPNYLCTYPHPSLWFCSKNKKSLSSTNAASCVLDPSLFQYLTVSLSTYSFLSTEIHRSPNERGLETGKSRVSTQYLLQLPFNAKLVESGLLFPPIPLRPLWNSFPDSHLGLHRVTSNCFPSSPLDLNHGSPCPVTLYPLDVPAIMPTVTSQKSQGLNLT